MLFESSIKGCQGAGSTWQKIAEEMKAPFLGRIPLDPKICENSDIGKPFINERSDSSATRTFMDIVKGIERSINIKAFELTPDSKT